MARRAHAELGRQIIAGGREGRQLLYPLTDVDHGAALRRQHRRRLSDRSRRVDRRLFHRAARADHVPAEAHHPGRPAGLYLMDMVHDC